MNVIDNNDDNNIKDEDKNTILVHNLRYVTDEKEVRQYFYDFSDVHAEQVLTPRNIYSGTWKVSFKTQRDMERALKICEDLIVRNTFVKAEKYHPCKQMKRAL